MIDKPRINHPVETITKIYHLHDSMYLFPFFMQIGSERMESKKGLACFILGDYSTMQNYWQE